ncbi:MAG TPA: alpha-L-fucosidase, partial [Candidatus Hydrogenedentes bacterium]|nr:alpha-L-fucosidase [Candidatus Hydrogenedentota bacterium]
MWKSTLLLAGSLILAGAMRAGAAAEPPAPCAPVPTAEQLAWQRDELSMFVHFTVNAFTDREWGDGTEDPKIFNPVELDCEQWARVAKETGFKLVILTTKHHDGFCLFPSDYTEHDIANAAWKDGRGDLVREFVEACRKYGLKVGFYLSPWDRHEPKYADNAAYDEHFRNQLTELLTRYGPVSEVWFDGAGGEGHVYDWQSYYALIRRLQPRALIAICGPDIRWVGNEDGFARENESSVQMRDDEEVWYPAECDVSIRPGWFWHKQQDDQVKSLEHLLDIYYRSVGRNSGLLLNVPPNDKGLFCELDIRRLKEWRAALDETFATDFAAGQPAVASNVRGGDEAFGPARALDGDIDTYWATDDDVRTASLEVDLGA